MLDITGRTGSVEKANEEISYTELLQVFKVTQLIACLSEVCGSPRLRTHNSKEG